LIEPVTASASAFVGRAVSPAFSVGGRQQLSESFIMMAIITPRAALRKT
jgi:hypothetical protein